MTEAPRGLAVAALLACAACAARDAVAKQGLSPSAAHCSSSGPPVLADGTCTGAIASAVFTGAVCACNALQFGSHVVADGFDSRITPWAFGGAGGDVGTNLGLSFADVLEVGGNLTVAAGAAEAGTRLVVGGDLVVEGDLGRPISAVTVGGAAQIGGNVSVMAMDVAGALTQPSGATRQGAVNAGQQQVGEVSIAPPCKCSAADGVDILRLITLHSQENDDAAIGLSPDAFASMVGEATLEVPCGLFYLSAIQTDGLVFTLRAVGRSAVFVQGEVAPLKVELATGAELDLFVDGPVNLAAADLGDPERPSALRIYKAGDGAMNIPQGSRLFGSLYAPDTDFASSAPFEVWGALVVRNLTGGGDATVHYDRAISAEALSCR